MTTWIACTAGTWMTGRGTEKVSLQAGESVSLPDDHLAVSSARELIRGGSPNLAIFQGAEPVLRLDTLASHLGGKQEIWVIEGYRPVDPPRFTAHCRLCTAPVADLAALADHFASAHSDLFPHLPDDIRLHHTEPRFQDLRDPLQVQHQQAPVL